MRQSIHEGSETGLDKLARLPEVPGKGGAGPVGGHPAGPVVVATLTADALAKLWRAWTPERRAAHGVRLKAVNAWKFACRAAARAGRQYPPYPVGAAGELDLAGCRACLPSAGKSGAQKNQ